MRPPWLRTSLATKRANSEGLSVADFTSVTAGSLRSLLSTPAPFWPPPCTRISPTSSLGAAAYSTSPSTDSSGSSSSSRTTTQRIEENSEGAASSPSAAIVRVAADVSLVSASGSAARTAASAVETVRWLRNSSGPVTSRTWPRMSDAFGFAMVRSACHTVRTAGPCVRGVIPGKPDGTD